MSERRMNLPIPGHELLYEGNLARRLNPETDMFDGYTGGCRCGAKPEDFPHVSTYKMKRWHRGHKAAIRLSLVLAARRPPLAAPLPPGDVATARPTVTRPVRRRVPGIPSRDR